MNKGVRKIIRRTAIECGVMMVSSIWSSRRAGAPQLLADERTNISAIGTAMPLARIDNGQKAPYPAEGYLGMQYTHELVGIQVTWVGGRSTKVKKRFFKQIANEIHQKRGIRKEDVRISLIESGREDWSFGHGEMQYGPK